MNTNMGLLPKLEHKEKKLPKKIKRARLSERAREDFKEYLVGNAEHN
jgi:folate-dependent tRNA-U54 methylase TrmFO/GidA